MKTTIDWVICNKEVRDSKNAQKSGVLKFPFGLKIRQAVMADKLSHPKGIIRQKNKN